MYTLPTFHISLKRPNVLKTRFDRLKRVADPAGRRASAVGVHRRRRLVRAVSARMRFACEFAAADVERV